MDQTNATNRVSMPGCLSESGILWIDDAMAASIATSDLAYRAVRDALIAHARGEFDQPLKPYVRPGGRKNEWSRGRLITMPAYLGGAFDVLGAKLITGFPANVDRGLPRASGLICLFDTTNGTPVAVMDCHTISTRRTAAVAALCVDHLAVAEPLIIAIIGAGPIARETVMSLLSSPSRNIDRVSIYDIRAERAEQLAAEFDTAAIDVTAAERLEDCLSHANVIVSATTGAKGIVTKSAVSGPWLIVALSLEDFDADVMLSADKLICDDFDQCNREEKLFHHLVGSGRISRDAVYAELGEVLAGVKLGREGAETIYVNPMGMAIEDLALASRVYAQALAQAGARPG
jgi:N-[(2S)-2-amino-2-carboxyethyl]-L-glutamate dehydrogenase